MAWDQIALAALLASLLALAFLLLVRFSIRLNAPSLPNVIGLTFCAGLGLTLWFIIFNTFSLQVLDFDFPIPLFPVSPEDLSCMVVTGLVSFIYWQFFSALFLSGNESAEINKNLPGRKEEVNEDYRSSRSRLGRGVWLIPALAALIIDVYFI
jgi:hypothetical protein